MENSELAGIDILDRYVSALNKHLRAELRPLGEHGVFGSVGQRSRRIRMISTSHGYV